MPPLIHAAAVARALGVSRMTISKALHSGRIAPCGKGAKGQPLFDLAEVQKVFVPDPAQTERPLGLQGGRPPNYKGYKSGQTTGESRSTDFADDETTLREKFLKARVAAAAATAKLKSFELAIREGKYILAEDARKQGAALGAVLIGHIHALPAKLAPTLAAMTADGADEFAFHKILTEALNDMILDTRSSLGLDSNSRLEGQEGPKK